MFDLFDFTPVADDPFKRGAGTPSPVVSEFQKSQPASAPATAPSPTDDSSYWDPRTWFKANPNATFEAGHAMSPESWAHYAGNPEHPMVGRIGSAAVEEARRFGAGVAGNVNKLVGPIYGEGHYPVFSDAGAQATGPEFAGAGINLAGMMGGPGGETGLGAGWNPGAAKYLDNLVKSKPPLQPKTMSAVQALIAMGPEWGQRFFEISPENAPGKGFAALATTKHLMEEAAKPKPPTVVTPGAAEAAAAAAPSAAAAPTTAAPPLQGAKPLKKPSVKSTPLTPEQALGFGSGATENELSPMFTKTFPPLKVPKMEPYVEGKPSYSMETAPGTSGQTLPFNPSGLPMDQASVMKRMEEQGFGPLDKNLIWWRGVAPHGPYSWDSAAVGYKNPATKDYEPGLFFHPDVNAYGKSGMVNANMYGTNLNPHVLRAENPLVTDWKTVSKGTMYNKDKMSKVIKDAWNKGHDALLLKNIHDLGGNHDQLIVRHPSQLRHPHAAFDPKYKDTANLLAARGTGVPPMVVQDQDLEGGDNNGQ